MFKRASLVAVFLTIVLCLSAASALAGVGWEYFDANPNWLEAGNREGDCDFGFSETNYAGGHSASEIGGFFKRAGAGNARYYGYNEPTSLTLNEELEINWNSADAAKIAYDNIAYPFEDNVQFGFFDRSTVGTWSNTRFLGVRVNDDELYLSVMCGSGLNTDLLIKGGLPMTGQYDVRLKYDPNAGSYGQITAQYNDEAPVTISLSNAQRSSGQSFNTIGLFAIGVTPSVAEVTDGIWWRVDDIYANGLTGSEQMKFPGDANFDGKVDEEDAMRLAQNWLTQDTAAWSMGDFNGDGNVDDIDATILAANWTGAGSTASVPEPSMLMLVGLGLSAMCLFRKRIAYTKGANYELFHL